MTSVALLRHVLLLRQGVVRALGFELHLGPLRAAVSSWGFRDLIAQALLGNEMMVIVAVLGQRPVHVVHHHPAVALGAGRSKGRQLWVEVPQEVSALVGVVKPASRRPDHAPERLSRTANGPRGARAQAVCRTKCGRSPIRTRSEPSRPRARPRKSRRESSSRSAPCQNGNAADSAAGRSSCPPQRLWLLLPARHAPCCPTAALCAAHPLPFASTPVCAAFARTRSPG